MKKAVPMRHVLFVSLIVIAAVVVYHSFGDPSQGDLAYLVAQSGPISSCGFYTGPGADQNNQAPDGVACLEEHCASAGTCVNKACSCPLKIPPAGGYVCCKNHTACAEFVPGDMDGCGGNGEFFQSWVAGDTNGYNAAWAACGNNCPTDGRECAGTGIRSGNSCLCDDTNGISPTEDCPGNGNYCIGGICMMGPVVDTAPYPEGFVCCTTGGACQDFNYATTSPEVACAGRNYNSWYDNSGYQQARSDCASACVPATTSAASSSSTSSAPACSDGKDNDGDGDIDFNDAGCYECATCFHELRAQGFSVSEIKDMPSGVDGGKFYRPEKTSEADPCGTVTASNRWLQNFPFAFLLAADSPFDDDEETLTTKRNACLRSGGSWSDCACSCPDGKVVGEFTLGTRAFECVDKCGNSVKDVGEACDPTVAEFKDGCNDDCTLKPNICGDNQIVEYWGEECDYLSGTEGDKLVSQCNDRRCCDLGRCEFCENKKRICVDIGGKWVGPNECSDLTKSNCECPEGYYFDDKEVRCLLDQCPEGVPENPTMQQMAAICRGECNDLFVGNAIETCVAECVCGCAGGEDFPDDNEVLSCMDTCLEGGNPTGAEGFTCGTPAGEACCRSTCVKEHCPAPDDSCEPFCGGGAPPPPACFPAPLCGAGGVNGCQGTIVFVNQQCQCDQRTFNICGDTGGDGGTNGNVTTQGTSVGNSSRSSSIGISSVSSSKSSSVSSSLGVSSVNNSSNLSSVNSVSNGNSSGFSSTNPSSQFSSVSLLCGNGVVDAGEACDNGKVCDINPSISCTSASDCRRCGLVSGEGHCGGVAEGAICASNEDCVSESFACVFDTDADPTCGSNCQFIGSSVSSVSSAGGFSSFDLGLSSISSSSAGSSIVVAFSSQSSVTGGGGNNGGGNEVPATCGNGVFEAGEECDDGNRLDGDACTSRCTTPICGDGLVSINEQCDDANTVNGDGCASNCQVELGDGGENNERCGNGAVEAGEECDDGNTNENDSCTPNCQTPVCGDGFIIPAEECDDGNVANGDGCASNCRIESPSSAASRISLIALASCGNRVVEGAEQCDDGNTRSGDGCSSRCRLELGDEDDGDGDNDDGIEDNDDGQISPTIRCGDGKREFPETCDDGNTQDGDGCNGACRVEFQLTIQAVCGNGVLEDGEECDDGNTRNNDACTNACRRVETFVAAAAVCGDGILADSEECDDSNRRENDGCSSTCQLEIGICGDGVVQALLGEQCENSTHDKSLPFECRQCRFHSLSCGDGEIDPGEDCDNGAENSSSPDASCRLDCSIARCGDGVLDSVEICDDGNRVNGDGCDRYCLIEDDAKPTQVASANDTTEIPFNQQSPTTTQQQFPFSMQFPMQANVQGIPYQLPLAQLQPLIQGQAPVGDTGPAAVAVVGAGAAAGFSWMRKRKK